MSKQNISTIMIFIAIFIVSVVFINEDKEHRIDTYLKKQHKRMNTQFNVINDEKYQLAQIIYNDIISDKKIISILEKSKDKHSEIYMKILRNKLYKQVNDKYLQWKFLGIKQLHFHSKDNISFLRMHKPNKFGDDLTNFRESINLTNQLKIPVKGFEMGRVASGFRYVFPIFAQDGSHIGSVEASISTDSFQEELEHSFHSKINFIIDKEIVDKKSFSNSIENKYKVTKISDKFYSPIKQYANASKIPKEVLSEITLGLERNKTFSVYFKNKKLYKIITFYPISNIKNNKNVAYFIKYSNSTFISNLYKDFYILISMIVILLLAIIIYIYNNNIFQHKLSLSLHQINQQKEELTDTVRELEEQNVQIAKQIEDARKKDTLIADQSRLASLGEMIGNIAHQWRQPLSAISTTASSLSIQNELGILDNNDLSSALGRIVNKTLFLSQTIEDFRNFIEGKKEDVEFDVSSAIDSAFSVVDSSISNHHISVIKNYKDNMRISNYKNEFIQGVLNIINNAKDALDDGIRPIDERILLVELTKKNGLVHITFQDNAEGISEDIITKIFEPYFTTKHQSQGTGLGLYMTYRIITQSMQGTLSVENTNFIHNGKKYFGAKFTITLPIKLTKEEGIA
ncbi:MAG TPA: hypothetical protein EYG73_01265 [Arcobacter sp.]|nr:hypothetical protein [Arcobacter sp.]